MKEKYVILYIKSNNKHTHKCHDSDLGETNKSLSFLDVKLWAVSPPPPPPKKKKEGKGNSDFF